MRGGGVFLSVKFVAELPGGASAARRPGRAAYDVGARLRTHRRTAASKVRAYVIVALP